MFRTYPNNCAPIPSHRREVNTCPFPPQFASSWSRDFCLMCHSHIHHPYLHLPHCHDCNIVPSLMAAQSHLSLHARTQIVIHNNIPWANILSGHDTTSVLDEKGTKSATTASVGQSYARPIPYVPKVDNSDLSTSHIPASISRVLSRDSLLLFHPPCGLIFSVYHILLVYLHTQ